MFAIEFAPLFSHLSGSIRGARLAKLSIQTKVEKFVLDEIASAGESRYPHLEFWLEESPRRDLTIRQFTDSGSGPLIEWVEAKMCYSDCVARALTKKGRVDEYCELLAGDVKKQDLADLPTDDRDARLTNALFVFHRAEPHSRHIYYPAFRNRLELTQDQVRQEAVRYCTEDIPHAIGRVLAERVDVRLDSTTELLGFFYRKPTIA